MKNLSPTRKLIRAQGGKSKYQVDLDNVDRYVISYFMLTITIRYKKDI